MPELPEVETIRRDLQYSLLGKGIRKVDCYTGRCLLSDAKEFALLKGNRFESIRRKGKLLVFDLAYGDKTLLIHLKMTGQLICEVPGGIIVGGHPMAKIDDLPNSYTHIGFIFADGTKLYFNDVRTFGWLHLATDEQVAEYLNGLGIDPTTPEFSWEIFLPLVQNRKGEVKAFLLNQSLIAGIGNIYADEILYRARIRPGRLLSTLTTAEQKRLFTGIKKIIEAAVSKRGTTFSNYVDASGKKGGYLKHLRVYNREGERCFRCGDDFIQKTRIAGRGTHYCESCQK